MATQLNSDERFFYENAGYSYASGTDEEEGHILTARALAHAETYSRNHSWYVVWDDDPEGCIGCDCDSPDCPCSTGEPHNVQAAILYDENDKVTGSLGAICEPTAAYRRVIAAELALDAIP